MIFNILYLILAVLGLGFLVFIHELGHYFAARRAHITIEVFSIGFGKPIYTWDHKGVKCQLCWLPFGGYVRMAGMEKKGELEPYQIPGGYYAQTPWKRIKVALSGPASNIAFALLAFTAIWATGGQEKPFHRYTNVIGALDSASKLYEAGIRPGDQIVSVDNKPVQGLADVFTTLLLSKQNPSLQGYEIDYLKGDKKNFSYSFDPKLQPSEMIQALGIAPAQYVFFDQYSSPASSLCNLGIEKGDRILWANGEIVFSKEHLSQVINQPKALFTVKRGSETFLSALPRLKASDLKMGRAQISELDDWQHEAGFNVSVSQLHFIPYNLTNGAVVESSINYLDSNAEEKSHTVSVRQPLEIPLMPGDRIIAVNGVSINNSIDLLKQLQNIHALLIIQKASSIPVNPWNKADAAFESSFDLSNLLKIQNSIGTAQSFIEAGDLQLIKSAPLLSFIELPLDPKLRELAVNQYEAEKKAIESIENTQEREIRQQLLEQSQKRLMLGVLLYDNKVIYNPSPYVQFQSVVSQTAKTLTNLVTGHLSPKHMSGPVGIIQALQYSWASGLKDAIFWLGFVSLNLAFLNLLPIPVLDGGHVVLAVVETIIKRPIKAKTMEKLIIPFVVLLIGFFIYVTYYDLTRLLGRYL
jgi:regulator of sigma E protease